MRELLEQIFQALSERAEFRGYPGSSYGPGDKPWDRRTGSGKK